MSGLQAVLTSRAPSGLQIVDFDLVDRDGHVLVIGTDRYQAFSWDPMTDQWTEHRLDVPSREFAQVELLRICAAAVDGRIVIGGGGDHQDFAQWDLETGAVLQGADGGSPSSARTATLGGRTLFVIGYTGPAVEVQSPAKHHDPDDDLLDSEEPEEDEDDDIYFLTTELESGESVAAGTLWGRPVIAASGEDGGVIVWDIDEDCPVAELDEPDGIDDETLGHFALAALEDRGFLAAAWGRVLAVCDVSDADASVWAEPIIVPGGEIECLDAGVVGGRVVAATGGEDGTLCLWDLADRRLLAEPNTAHVRGKRDAPSEVFAVRFAELNDRPAAITAGRDGTVRVWDLPEIGSNKRNQVVPL
ncbi:hypothetical protein OG417_29840 [Actinoallomurus sp. NBC_01490]|uniref:WD40 repeat domain-containing protein n=1 Tax=Actinoallomurus sp. NBC_01490 TaxID=2903557 RepID=UPI002E2F4898|nr:hypothetical protein [Actinoallomurus sp. NBC_01490]